MFLRNDVCLSIIIIIIILLLLLSFCVLLLDYHDVRQMYKHVTRWLHNGRWLNFVNTEINSVLMYLKI